MRDRCYILDKADVQTCRLKRADCGLTSRSGSLNVNLNGLHTVIDSLLCSCLGCALCSEGSALTRALEAHLAGRCPRYGITVSIGDRNDRVVECSTDMRCSALDILFLAAFLDYLFSYLCHLYSFTPLLLLIRNSLRRTLACSCVCLSALTSDGQTLAMTDTTVAVNLYHALDVECNITAEVTLYLVVCFDFLTELCDLLLGECLSAGVRIDACLCKYLIRSAATYTVDIGKGDLNALSVRNIYACNTCHLIYSLLLTRQESALSLFVFRILAYHHDLAVATDNLTFIAYLFNGRFNFHFNYRSFLPWYAM